MSRSSTTIAIDFLTAVLTTPHGPALTSGAETHEPALRFVGQLVWHTKDPGFIEAIVRALLPEGYSGNTSDELPGMIGSAIKKGFGRRKPKGSRDRDSRQKVSEGLLQLIQGEGAELFHNEQHQAFISMRTPRGGRRSHAVNSDTTRDLLRHSFYRAHRKAISDTALTEAIDTLSAIARFDGPIHPVYLRIAAADGRVYVDLGDDSGEFVCISADGWTLVPDAPLRFYRSPGFGVLPRPKRGGDLRDLRALLGLNDTNWLLFLAFLLGCLKPNGPYMFLLVEGEQGSGKSHLCAVAKRLIDPNVAEKLRLPKSERDLMIQAKDNGLLVYDNTSGIKSDISDALCSVATGGAISNRQLYTDDTAHTLKACRPVVINGIGEFANRPDLLERSIQLHLPTMPPAGRRTERELWAQFEQVQPGILGSLFDIVAGALKRYDEVTPPTTIRMADAAQWLVAAEPAAGVPDGTFIRALENAQADTMIEKAMHDPVVIAIAEVVAREHKSNPLKQSFEGTVGELYKAIELYRGDHKFDRFFPATPAHLSTELKRLAPAMAKVGLTVEFGTKTNRGRLIRISFDGPEPPLVDMAKQLPSY